MTNLSTNSVSPITCQLFVSSKFYLELNEHVKELFKEADSGFYFAEFPAEVENSSYLGEYLIAFCEVVLIIANPKYEYTDQCELNCELMKLGTDESSFNLLISIRYPGVASTFHDILIFKEREQRIGFYAFELLGDQTMFSID